MNNGPIIYPLSCRERFAVDALAFVAGVWLTALLVAVASALVEIFNGIF